MFRHLLFLLCILFGASDAYGMHLWSRQNQAYGSVAKRWRSYHAEDREPHYQCVGQKLTQRHRELWEYPCAPTENGEELISRITEHFSDGCNGYGSGAVDYNDWIVDKTFMVHACRQEGRIN